MEVCPQFNDATGFVGAATIAQAKLFNMDPFRSSPQRRTPPRPSRRRRHPGVRLRAKLRPGLPQATPLTEAISDMGRDVFIQQVKDLFAR